MTPLQFKAARALLDITMHQMADECGLALMTLARLQAGVTVSAQTIATVRATIERLGVELIEPDGGKGEGVRLLRCPE
jgi:transcriptional regulator with XRE-family HTH domain